MLFLFSPLFFFLGSVQMNNHRAMRDAIAAYDLLASAVLLALFSPAAFAFGVIPAGETQRSAGKPMFDKTGPQVGDQLPDLKLRAMKGEPARLGDVWHGGPGSW